MLAGKFEEQVLKYAEKTAVKTDDKELTYHQLNSHANGAAKAIIRQISVVSLGSNTCNVALLFEHGIDMIIGTLGALKAGVIYIPFDPAYPVKRLEYMLQDAEVKMVLTNSRNLELAKKLSKQNDTDVKVVNIDDIDTSEDMGNLNIRIDENEIAYILYTSGSTGMPKGVYQSHKNIYHFVNCYRKTMEISSQDKMTLFSAFSHDAAIMDIYSALLAGATLYPLNIKEQGNFLELASWLQREEITIWHSVPTLYRYFINALKGKEKFPALKYIVLGGEIVIEHDVEMFKELFPYTKLVNLYGQTESSFNSAQIFTAATRDNRITLGDPVKETELVVIDEDRNEVSELEVGEIVVLSEYIAHGYWKDEEKTKLVFENNRNLGRLYWTGDLGRLLPDGTIKFVGRKGSVVKIRGYRVDTGEVESCLLKHEAIREAVVIGKVDENQSDDFLCAYFTSDKKIEAGELKAYLSDYLPEYMLPAFFTQLEKMPLTANGKLDRKALPEPERNMDSEAAYEAPGSISEEKLVAIWREILQMERVGINDNFFNLGGHSLKATALVSKIHSEFGVEVPLAEIFKSPTIKQIASYLEKAEKNIYASIKPAEEKEYYEASSAQKRIYMLQQLDKDSISYNMPRVLQVSGRLDRARVEAVCNIMIQRHETLRTSFATIDDQIVQKIDKNLKLNIEYEEVDENSSKELIESFVKVFDLSKAPLFRVGLIKISEEKHILMFDMHHIISDGTSTGILIYEFAKLYGNGELGELEIQYKDFSEWQNSLLRSEKMKTQEEYWINRFSREIPVLNLKSDFTRPLIQSFEGDSIRFHLDKDIIDGLKRIAIDTGSTMYMILLSALNILLSKYSAQEDIIIGSPIAGRHNVELEKIIGMFVNTLAMRNYPVCNKSYLDFLSEVKENALRAYDNQDYQFEELIDKLKLPRNISRNPLFDVMFIMQNMSRNTVEFEELEFKEYVHSKKVSKFDLTFIAYEIGEEILMEIEYCTKLFRKTTIERIEEDFANILRAIGANKNIEIREINLLSEEEKSKLVYDFNNTYAEYPSEMLLHELFEKQVKLTPDKTALMFGNEKVTYDWLNKKANSLARKLQKMGACRESVIAMQVERSIEMLVGIMAVLKAGGAYLPIDPEYPEERVSYMLGDSKAEILMIKGSYNSKIHFNGQIIDLQEEQNYAESNDNLEKFNTSRDLAYVIYTSGSTGMPKGVAIEHRSAINTLTYLQKNYPVSMDDVYLFKTNYTFDVSIAEIFGWFMGNGALAVVSNAEGKDINAIADAIKKYKATHINFVPSMLNMLVEAEDIENKTASLKYVFAAGEELKAPLAKKFYKKFHNIRLENLYGPTEATIYASGYSVDKALIGENIPIGKPIANSQVYIVDKHNEILPIGIPGELCISGAGIARGYINKSELTAQKFIPNPFIEGSMMYKTGDLARWLPEGNIEFLGRIDHQVKIRGFRIELGEIESQLCRHEAVKEAVVIDREDSAGIKYLCSYIVAHRDITAQELREFLSKNIPNYMIPSYFISLDKLPLNSSGKIDRRSLPEVVGNIATGVEFEAPRNEIEEALVRIWSEVLDVEKVGINHNFFELGGHSLKATILVSKCQKEFGIDIPLGEIFKNPTVKALSEYISRNTAVKVIYIKPADEREYYPVSSSQRRMFILNQLNPKDTSYNMPMVFKAKGMLHMDKVEKAMRTLIQRHESLRTSFHIEHGEVVQRVEGEPKVEIACTKAEGKSIDEMISTFIKPFNLAVGPLVRLEVIDLSQDANIGDEADEYMLLFDIHHIVSDGFSTGIMIDEFMKLYEGKELPMMKLQYKDYSVWEKNLYDSGEMKKQEQYWLDIFKEEPPKLNMPLDYERPEYQTFNGNRLKFEIASDAVNKMEVITQKQGATLNIVLCSIYSILLHKYSGQEDITTGMIMAGRRYPYLDSIIGAFINFLPIRSSINPSLTFNEFLKLEKTVITEAYDNQNYPFDELVGKVVKTKDKGRNPLFDSMFILHNEQDARKEYKLKDIEIEAVEISKDTSKLDFQVDAVEDAEGKLKCMLEYNTNLFKEESMRDFIKHFEKLIIQITDNSDVKISDLNIFENGELEAIEIKRNRNNRKLNVSDVVVASTFTDVPLGEYIKWWCEKFSEPVDIKFAPYNQVFQQLLDKESLVNKNPGISIILVRFEDWIRDIKAAKEEKCSILKRNYEDLMAALRGKQEESVYLFGIFQSEDASFESEVLQCIEELKMKVEKDLKQIKNIFQFDLRDIERLYSIRQVFDPFRDKVGHIPFTDEYYAAMGTTIARKILALRKTPFKVITLDCDNTLWKGICGEDGPLGVEISKEYEELQKMLIQKYEEGMLLVLCSKNNERDVWEVFESNSGMLLRKEHFAAWRINWNSKSENLKQLAEELNLGIDSFIFIDDSPVECSEVMMNQSEVLTLQLPEDITAIPIFIKHIWAFDRVKVTKEDRLRTQMYTAEKERKGLMDKNKSIGAFLKSLQLKMSMNFIQEENMERAYQLIQKTNQFNLSTIRRTEEELRALAHRENIVCWVIEVQDRFGDYGLVGVVIAEKQEAALFIDTFLLSCRALGRGIEDAILEGIAKYCKMENIKTLSAHYYPTAKNKPFLEFIEKGLWKKVKQAEDYIEFQICLDEFKEQSSFIDCYYNSNYKELEVEEEAECYKDFLQESACANENLQPCSIESLNQSKAPWWEVNIPDNALLKHKDYLIALNNYTSERLLQLPVVEENSTAPIVDTVYEAPENETEERLIEIWNEIFKTSGIGVNHNFFHLGGHSLNATTLAFKIHNEFNVEMPLHEIFRLATIKEIAKFINAKREEIASTVKQMQEDVTIDFDF